MGPGSRPGRLKKRAAFAATTQRPLSWVFEIRIGKYKACRPAKGAAVRALVGRLADLDHVSQNCQTVRRTHLGRVVAESEKEEHAGTDQYGLPRAQIPAHQ